MGARVYWDVLQKYSVPTELKDVMLLGTPTIAPAQYFGNKEAKVPADMAGQRVRSGGQIEAWLIEALGATPVEISTGELSTSMERGMADSCFLSYSFGLITGIKDVTKYRTEINEFYRSFMLIMNKKVWDSMPTVLQEQMMSVSGPEASAIYSAANEALAAEDKAAIEGSDKGAGNPPIYVPTAEEMKLWVDASKPVWDKWVQETGGDAQAVVDMAVELTAKYAAMPPIEVTTTTAVAGTTGIFFEDLGGGKVKVTIIARSGPEVRCLHRRSVRCQDRGLRHKTARASAPSRSPSQRRACSTTPRSPASRRSSPPMLRMVALRTSTSSRKLTR